MLTKSTKPGKLKLGSAMLDENEKLLWRGRSSQIINLPFFILCLGIAIASVFVKVFLAEYFEGKIPYLNYFPLVVSGIASFWALWIWLGTYLNTYEITTERFFETSGVLNRDKEEVELYRVKDTSEPKPFFLRLFGLGNVIILSSDKTAPKAVIYAVKNNTRIRNILRKQVELARQRKGVRELD